MKRDDPDREFSRVADEPTLFTGVTDITDAPEIESQGARQNAVVTARPEPPAAVRVAAPGSAILDDPVTDRNGRAPNPPPKGA